MRQYTIFHSLTFFISGSKHSHTRRKELLSNNIPIQVCSILCFLSYIRTIF
nr:MAG TPA: hypothetical protein [Bacteriophage sp.]